MHACPHCGASTHYRSIWSASFTRPYTCPTCHGRSWYRQPFGLGILGAILMAAGSYGAVVCLPRAQVTFAFVGLAFLFMCVELFVAWRFGVLRAIAGSAS